MTTHMLELVKSSNRFDNEVAEFIFAEMEDVLDDDMLSIAVKLLADDRPEVRAAALNVVDECGSNWPLETEVAEEVLRCLKDSHPLVRRAALQVARRTIGSDWCEAFVYDLVRCIGDPDSGNRDAAIQLLMEEFAGAFDTQHFQSLAEYVSQPAADGVDQSRVTTASRDRTSGDDCMRPPALRGDSENSRRFRLEVAGGLFKEN